MLKEILSSLNKKAKGSFYEEKAKEYLLKKGFKVLYQNFRYKNYEIDIIAMDQEKILVFCEVKFRSFNNLNNLNYSPYETIPLSKQKKLIKASKGFLAETPIYQNHYSRYDVILILFYTPKEQEKIIHIENAFVEEGDEE